MGFVSKTRISLLCHGQLLALVISVPSTFSGRPHIIQPEQTYGIRGCHTGQMREVIFTETV